jgi:hypothetical protein
VRSKNKGVNVEKYLKRSVSYEEYSKQIDLLVKGGDTTGPEKSTSRISYTKLNRQRMARLDKTTELSEAVKQAAARNGTQMIWLVITESWCGDAAQNIPIIEKIAAESDIIETRYILRDENLELMDRFHENGARSIPRLIALDRKGLAVLGTWGSRPSALKEYYVKMKSQQLEKAEIGELLQRWYNEDKGRSLQNEFYELINRWGGSIRVSVAA